MPGEEKIHLSGDIYNYLKSTWSKDLNEES